MIIEAIRAKDWAAALAAYGAGQGDEVESDYAFAHLWERYGYEVDARASIMRLSIWIKSVQEWNDSLLDGVPDEVLHRFACACAIRALVAEEAAGKTVDPRSWMAVATKLAWLHGLASDEELETAKKAAWAAAAVSIVDAAWAAAETRAAGWAAEEAAFSNATRAAREAASWVAGWTAEDRRWQIQTLADLCRRWALRVRSNK
jgi:hypothetical protein